MVTLREVLEPAVERLRAGGSESARLDAELLLGHALGLERTGVLAHPSAAVGEGQRERFAALLERRLAGEPVAYIRGVKEFYGIAFGVDARALIPRPETETLVEVALARIRATLSRAPRAVGTRPFRVLDVGTGSGAVVVALARTLARAGYLDAVRFTASDRSERALSLAIENAVGHGVADRIDFRVADLLTPAVEVDGPVDLVVANLPYVPTDDLASLPIAASFEPREALDGGSDGLALVRTLLAGLPIVLGTDGAALLEIGADQADAALAAAAALLPGWPSRVHDDLGGEPRVLDVSRPA
ncbi:MAG: peptide chain release factor N(5)-glutamine methyltransferase [Candidatus Limnocylindrales bacterium]